MNSEDNPITEQPVTEQPVTEQPVTEQPVSEQPIIAETAETTEFSLFGKSKTGGSAASLELIRKYESLIVKQELDVMGSMFDKCFCCDKLNKYKVKDTDGKTVLKAIEEEESCCAVNCCRRGQRFEMKLMDNTGNQVIRLKMKNQCCGRCLCFCRYRRLQVYDPIDNKLGSIEESWNCFHKQLLIYMESKSDPVYYVNGPNCESCRCCSRCCCSDFTFTIYKYESGEECGSIAKKWSGLTKETLTYADNFYIKFPQNIELTEKAVLLSTCIMIDLMYFEKRPKEEDDDD